MPLQTYDRSGLKSPAWIGGLSGAGKSLTDLAKPL